MQNTDEFALIGLTEADAEAKLQKLNMKTRVVEIDGEGFMGTDDYWTDRVNVAIAQGKVISVIGRG